MGASKKHAASRSRPTTAASSDESAYPACRPTQQAKSHTLAARLRKHRAGEAARDAGEKLVSAGDPITAVFFLREGILLAQGNESADRARISNLFWPGDLVLADPAARCWAVDLRACTEVRADVHDLAGVHAVMRDDPDLATWLFDTACAHFLQHLDFEHRLRILAVEGRFAALMVRFANCLGRPYDGGRVFSLPLLRAELASYLGLRTETICRVLARWQKRGLITLQGRRTFIIHSLADIEALALGAGQQGARS